MTDDELKELVASLAIEQKALQKTMEATSAEIRKTNRETSKQIKELGKQIGGLGEKFGSFTEGFAFPSMQKVLAEKFGMDNITTRCRSKKEGKHLELDVFAYSNDKQNEAVIVEVKSYLREEYIEQILKQLKDVKWFLPEHANKTFYGVLAIVDGSKELKEKVLKKGIYLAEIHDNIFDLKNPANFKPSTF